MPCVGFILRPQKRPRVLTPTLSAAAAARGLALLALDPDSTPQQWREAGVDVLVHKAPDEEGLDVRLQQWAAAAVNSTPQQQQQEQQQQQWRVLLDPPAAVRRLQDRQAMLQPLEGGPLTLTRPAGTTGTQQDHSSQHTPAQVSVSIPSQVVLQQGCSMQQAQQQLAAAGLRYPLLVKPLISAATDSARPLPPAAAAADDDDEEEEEDGTAAGGSGAPSETGSAVAVAAAAAAGAAANDGHTLGVIFSPEGLQALLQSVSTGQQQASQAVTQQQQQQQQQGEVISLPVVLQQYVPHEALYKLYVIGPSCVLTRRNTLTLDILEAAAAAAGASRGKQGVVILPRLSADKLAAVAAAQQQQQQQVQPAAAAAAAQSAGETATSSSNGGSSVGVALADASVAGDAAAPPLWAVQALAGHLRAALGLNLFNVDIITPSVPVVTPSAPAPRQQQQQQQQQLGQQQGECQQQQQQTTCHCGPQQQSQEGQQQLLVVDINYFPGYDKVPGAELLFADFLAQCAAVADPCALRLRCRQAMHSSNMWGACYP